MNRTGKGQINPQSDDRRDDRRYQYPAAGKPNARVLSDMQIMMRLQLFAFI